MKKSAAAALVMLFAMNTAFAEVSHSDSVNLKSGKRIQQEAEVYPADMEKQVKQAQQQMKVQNNVPQTAPQVKTQAAAPKQVSKDDPFNQFKGKPLGTVTITENKNVPTDQIMKYVKSKSGDKVSEELIRGDLESIFSDGWCQNVKPEFKLNNGKVDVVYHYIEAPIIKDVEVEGASVLNKDFLRKQFVTGKMMNRTEISDKLTKLVSEYHEAGYIAANVAGGQITEDGVFHILVVEGKIANFKVTGNKKTKDFVVLREMRQKVGDPLNSKLLQRSLQRVYNLGFFEEVTSKINPGPTNDTIEVEVIVEEANTATVSVGAGYSDSDGVVGTFTIQDKNFRGRGDNAMLRWEFGGEDHNRNYELSYTKPWLDKKETTMSVSIYDMTNEYADYDRDGSEIARYDKRRRGQEITFSRAGSEYTRNYITLRHRDDKYKEPEKGYKLQYYEPSFDIYLKHPDSKYHKYEGKWPATAEERRKENFGDTWSVQLMHVYDSRDSYLFPTKGKRMNYSAEFGFAGDFKFTKWDAEWRYYYPLGKNVLAWDTEIGYATGKLPLSHRFTAGGTNYLRGYKDNQFRGNSLLRTTLEYRIPIAKKVTGVLFADYGYAWDKRDEDAFDLSKMKFGYGVGVRAQTPIGMLRLDYGISSSDHRFHFSFGGSF